MKMNYRRCLASLALLPVLLLAACGTQNPKLPHIQVERLSHPVVFADGVTRLNHTERDSLDAFTNPIAPSAVSHIALAADDQNLRSVARARSVRDYLIRAGFDKQSIRLVPMPGIDPKTVVLSIDYTKGVPPAHCPDWSKNSITDYNNTDASNFGCAYYSDLIVQLANPADYNGGHANPVSDAPRESAYIQRYMSGAASSASSSSSTSSGSSGSAGGSTSTTTSTP